MIGEKQWREWTRLACGLTVLISFNATFGQESPNENPPVLESIWVDPPDDNNDLRLFATPSVEWVLHKTEDGSHPDGNEQAMIWLMNRARSNPTKEGLFLSDTGDPQVASAINYFNVNLSILKSEFAAIAPMEPAAFDRRIYEGSQTHSLDLIARDAQDHNGQFQKVSDAGFTSRGGRASVFSYSRSALHAHAGFNIDWGGGTPDGMQVGRGHRAGLMSSGTNVGIAMAPENNSSTSVGPLVTSIAYLNARSSAQDHFNKFLVGTVWNDDNDNGIYDNGEGLSGVTVMPDDGTYFAITGVHGGYSIPISADREYLLNFSGGDLAAPQQRTVVVEGKSALVAWKAEDIFETSIVDPNPNPEPTPLPPTDLNLALIGSEMEVSWTGIENTVYNLESSVDGVNWSEDNRSITVAGAVHRFTVTRNSMSPVMLFRIRTSSPE